jgi:hypothetical protein
MEIATYSYTVTGGWSAALRPELDSERTLVLVFGAPGYFGDPAPLCALRDAYPRARIIGCSTAGEILGSKISDESMAVAVARFQHTDLAVAAAPVATEAGSFAAGRALARALGRPDLRGVLVLSDGLQVNGSELSAGLESALPPRACVTGGLAGDGSAYQRTWVLADGAPRTGAVTAVGFYGDHVRLGQGSNGGWDAFGPERLVTRAEGSVLYELDGKPALELYKQYLGELAAGLPSTGLLFPLSLRPGGAGTDSVVRSILGVDEAAQSMRFAGDIPVGHRARVMKATFDRLVDGAYHAGMMTADAGAGGGPALAVAISCVGRRLVMGARAEEEVEASLGALPPGTRQVGFYAYGAMSPSPTGRCSLHNQAMTLIKVSEA